MLKSLRVKDSFYFFHPQQILFWLKLVFAVSEGFRKSSTRQFYLELNGEDGEQSEIGWVLEEERQRERDRDRDRDRQRQRQRETETERF